LVLPYAIAHGITWNEVILVIIGVVKAAATEFGVIIRTDGFIDATSNKATVNDPAVVTSVPPMAGPVGVAGDSGAVAGLVVDHQARKLITTGSPMTQGTYTDSQ
jgi:hypothetical protein